MRKRIFKKAVLFFGGALLLTLFIIFSGSYKSSEKTPELSTPSSTLPPTVMTGISQEELQQYYDTYKRPYVIHIRKAFDAYLAHDSSKACIQRIAVDSRSDMGVITGLDSFSKNYYRSKFVVVTINDSKYFDKAKDIQIMFQDKPDRVFYALVGKNPNDPKSEEYCLLGFNSDAKIDQEEMQKSNEFYGPLLFDKEHAL